METQRRPGIQVAEIKTNPTLSNTAGRDGRDVERPKSRSRAGGSERTAAPKLEMLHFILIFKYHFGDPVKKGQNLNMGHLKNLPGIAEIYYNDHSFRAERAVSDSNGFRMPAPTSLKNYVKTDKRALRTGARILVKTSITN